MEDGILNHIQIRCLWQVSDMTISCSPVNHSWFLTKQTWQHNNWIINQLLSVNMMWVQYLLRATLQTFIKCQKNMKILVTYLLALSHKPSRIDRTFFSLLTDGAKTDACKWLTESALSKEEKVGRNQGANARHIPRRMVVSRISGYSQQRHVRHKSASRKWKPADLKETQSEERNKLPAFL